MNETLQCSPLGIALAILFSGSMATLFWWMLHVPPALSPQAAKARQSIKAWRRILVPTVGEVYSDRAVEMACRLGHGQEVTIFVAYIDEIPRTLALATHLAEIEQRAADVLAQASEIVKRSGLPVESVARRGREAGVEICALARRLDVDLIVMSMRPRLGATERLFGRTSNVVLRRAPCEVLIDRPA
ncbi:MAG TPA: universal stress protein [Candidatus Binataceae bacterium]|nr:universal stress protein [Candidatus Binataceae bacterium]